MQLTLQQKLESQASAMQRWPYFERNITQAVFELTIMGIAVQGTKPASL